MRSSPRAWLAVAVAVTPIGSLAADIQASAPREVSVSIYRAPLPAPGGLDADRLQGFALVSESRAVSLPQGESRIRFEGVADGIESESALVTGLPGAVIEKNRDARVLSPGALIEAALGRDVELVRTDPRARRPVRVAAKILSDAGNGVLFQTAEGIEALRCSGLHETFLFSATSGIGASPTLSVTVRSRRQVSANIALSYLAHGFDWTANYLVTLAPDGRTMDMGAWVTLANGNGVSFPAARTQIIAGRVNRVTGLVQPYELARGILAQCWPRGSTSDVSFEGVEVHGARPMFKRSFAVQDIANIPIAAAPAQLVQEEALGDLKLYRVPERTNLRSRQIKQVRLLDRKDIPVRLIYEREILANEAFGFSPAARRLRTRNDAAHHLGQGLPSGHVATFTPRAESAVLLAEAPLGDVAVDEEFEFGIGDSPDVQIRSVREQGRPEAGDPAPPELPDIVHLKSARVDAVNRVEIRNATAAAIAFELSVRLRDGTQLIAADRTPTSRNGRPLFDLKIPAAAAVVVRYQTEHTARRTGIG